ncbi:MAG: energy-coupling factor ABC transporter permease [Euryarchaeota archaeon]|nr:energy-coupling factor ABC transporter permease [Euryarchaeota archaeon]MBV1729156.1 energy-coupling factor ABC transporter permease [Methanobacterium sp.]MBU4547363.1 energy-coupling factor ABC transporter permease [Euryarchaeota archaeon]MBU4607495.1 energy-coupling factor ABC transporter permease [Euryarchaeota archaeon]MBV1754716.1 energy-coupling factor ABC transporter permease [Methanobacterium sp.]
MHVPDGIIPLSQSVIYWIISIITVIIYTYKISRDENKEKRVFTTALLVVASIIGSSLSIPSPLGVPIHFFIIPLVAIILGPLSASVVAFLTLIIQYFFLGMGGITTLGANTFTIGVVLSFSAYIFYTLLKDLDLRLGIFSGTFMGIIMATLAHVLILLVAGIATLEVLIATLVPFYLFIAVLESAASVVIISFINKIKPELLSLNKI